MFKTITERVIVSTITAVLLGVVFFLWGSLQGSTTRLIIPQGAVVAFDRACPHGWDDYDKAGGRFIVGAGEHTNKDDSGSEILSSNLESTGGYQAVAITEAQMPRHSHSLAAGPSDWDGQVGSLNAGNVREIGGHTGFSGYVRNNAAGQEFVELTGGSEPHTNIPPFVALSYCIKL